VGISKRASHGRVSLPHRSVPQTGVYLADRSVPHRRVPHRQECTSQTGVYLTGVYLIYESSLRAGPGWRESLYRYQGCLEASDCGRLRRQASRHPWSALRVVKSCRKTAQRLRCCSKPKQQLCIQNGTRVHYLNYLQRGRVRRGKETQAMGLASQSDRQKSDGETGNRHTD
jgi:hypothetical protein